jgi:phosphoribosyl 1,2-cyclic phosphate phosphodiesterase
MNREGLDVRDWIALLLTHSHDDHFAPAELQYCVIPFNDHEYLDFSIYGNAKIVDDLWTRYPNWPLDIHQTNSFSAFSVADYRITPFRANHKLDEDSQNFVIERQGKKLIYATDTGVIFPESMDYLSGQAADALIIECTEGFVPTQYHGHLDIHECRQMVESLRKNHALRQGARVVTVHHADQGEGTHDELSAALSPDGIEVGYDGMVIDLTQ